MLPPKGLCTLHFEGQTAAEAMMSQGRAGPHLDQNCFVMHTLALSLNLNFM